MANERVLSLHGRHVLQETIGDGAVSDWVTVFSPTGMTKVEVLYADGQSGSAGAYIETSFADAVDANIDAHIWDDNTVGVYTVSVLAGVRAHVRCTSSSKTVSWRVSI